MKNQNNIQRKKSPNIFEFILKMSFLLLFFLLMFSFAPNTPTKNLNALHMIFIGLAVLMTIIGAVGTHTKILNKKAS